jgi:hypothetical protein
MFERFGNTGPARLKGFAGCVGVLNKSSYGVREGNRGLEACGIGFPSGVGYIGEG